MQASAHVRSIFAGIHEALAALFGRVAADIDVQAGPAAAARTDEVSVVVSLTGTVQGRLLFGMSERVACGLAGALLRVEVPAFDEMARSGVAEIANIIAGGCATALHREGYAVAITVPSVTLGDHVDVSGANMDVVEAIFVLPTGEIRVVVGLRSIGG